MTGEVVDSGPFVEKDGEDPLMMCFDCEFLFLTLISSLLTLFLIYSNLRMNAKGLFKKGIHGSREIVLARGRGRKNESKSNFPVISVH